MNLVRTTLAIAALMGLATASQAQVFAAGPGLGLELPDDDPGGITSTIDVTGGAVENVRVIVSIDHTWVGDLIMTLTSPSGTTVSLVDRAGSEDGGFGDSSDLSSALSIGFNDGHEVSSEDAGADCINSPTDTIGDGCARVFIPRDMLGGFVGEGASGTWTLFISDNAGGDLGALNGWVILLNNPGIGM
ncbi:MAG: proprotein convertase P-domain-containing protein [Pseudomonadota bacterium]